MNPANKPSLCPNCGAEVAADQTRCANCGYALYPRPQLENPKKYATFWPTAPMPKPASIIMLIVVGLPSALCGGCGFLAYSSGSIGFGIVFALLGFGLLGYLIYEVRRAFRRDK